MSGHEFFDTIALAFEVVGVSAMVIGFIVAIGITLRTWAVSRSGPARSARCGRPSAA